MRLGVVDMVSKGVLNVLAHPDVFDRVLDWKLYRGVQTMMTREWRIEIRTTHEDKSKDEAFKQALIIAAAQIYAKAGLLADRVKPDIALYCDDWFGDNQQINVLAKMLEGTELAPAAVENGITPDMEAAIKAMQE